MKKLKYKDSVERASLIIDEQAKGLVLLEEQNHFDGNFLIFGEPQPLTDNERISALELRVAALEKKP